MIRKFLTAAALAAITSFSAVPSMADTAVGSWNVEHLGWDNGKDVRAVAKIASAFDLITLQEVMSLEGLDALERELEAVTGEDWESMASDAIGRGSYRERYAFLWRPSQVTWVDGAVVYIDDRDAFSREPMSMRFETSDNYRFVLASAHLIYGDSEDEREYEATALAGYRNWLESSFEGTPIYIAGDFNLPPDNIAWSYLGVSAAPLITDGATTLSPVNNRFANLYDNIWAPADRPVPLKAWGIYNYPDTLGMTHKVAREKVSDHAPVWMEIDTEVEWISLDPHAKAPVQSSATGANQFRDVAALGAIRGNRNSKIYHLAGCPGFNRMSKKNIVTFDNESAAREAGYRMAKNCS